MTRTTKKFLMAAPLIAVLGLVSPSTIPAVAQPQAADAEMTTDRIFRDGTPAALLEDISQFDRTRSMAADEARQRIIERGPAQVPAILAALDDAVLNNGTNAQVHHLILAFAELGGAGNADEFVAIARKIDPNKLDALWTYDVLDQIGASDIADLLAFEIISDADSNGAPLMGALSRYWYSASANVSEQALQHTDNELPNIRSIAYRVAFVGGLGEKIRDELIEDVTNVNQLDAGDVTMMNVMAAMEPEADFTDRIEGLDLRPSTRNAARLMNQFVWRDSEQKEALLPKMLRSSVSELRSTAIAYILASGRGDLLSRHRLAYVNDPYAIYRTVIPDFDNLSREQRLEYIDEEILAHLESQVAEAPTVSMQTLTRHVSRRLGYSLVVADDGKSILIRR